MRFVANEFWGLSRWTWLPVGIAPWNGTGGPIIDSDQTLPSTPTMARGQSFKRLDLNYCIHVASQAFLASYSQCALIASWQIAPRSLDSSTSVTYSTTPTRKSLFWRTKSVGLDTRLRHAIPSFLEHVARMALCCDQRMCLASSCQSTQIDTGVPLSCYFPALLE